jgi:hypothetical protein
VKNSVVLISEKISDRVLLAAKLWKECGYSVCLIYGLESLLYGLNESGIDSLIKAANPEEAVVIASRIRKNHLHYFNYGPDNIGLSLLKHNIPYFLDYKDLFSGVMNVEWGYDQHNLEKLLVKNAKHITNRDDQIYNYCKVNNIEIDESKLIHLPECINSDPAYEIGLIKKISGSGPESILRDIEVVMTGGFTEAGESNIVPSEGASLIIAGLLEQGIGLTIIGGYSNTNDINNRYKIEKFDGYLKAGSLKILPYMNPDEFEEKLKDYDFAIHMCNADVSCDTTSLVYQNSCHYEYSGSARLYSYVKANLPILVGSKRLRHIIGFFSESGYIVPISADEFFKLKKILIKLRAENIKEKIYGNRVKYSYTSLLKSFKDNISSIENPKVS